MAIGRFPRGRCAVKSHPIAPNRRTEQLIGGLTLNQKKEIAGVTQQIAKGDIDNLSIRGRYLELKYDGRNGPKAAIGRRRSACANHVCLAPILTEFKSASGWCRVQSHGICAGLLKQG